MTLGGAKATGSAGVATGSASAAGSLPAAENWVEAVRMQRWAEAARLIDALEPKAREAAEVRYVRARAAIALDDHARAVKLLDGLEKQLPALTADIARQRAEAQLQAGPYEPAAKYFATRPSVSALSKAALAFERAGKLRLAWGAAEHAIVLAQKKKRPASEQAQARAIRARVAEQQGKLKLAIADLRWLATATPTSEHADGADQRLEKLSPGSALTKSERYERALGMARARNVQQTERELELLGKAPGKLVRPGDVLHARAWALYTSRQDYAKASELFAQAAKLGSQQVVRDLFYSARARSRAHDDEQAIKLYVKLAQRYPRSGYAERARYLAARLLYILGKWDEAVRAYGAYLKRYGKKGSYRKSAEYERAVAWLASQKWDQAARSFEALTKREDEALRLHSYRHLHGVALAGAGKKAQAAKLFRRVIRDYPLSFPALMSVLRLLQVGESQPEWIEPASSGPAPPPLKLRLPAKVQLLQRIGLDADAERELKSYESQLKKAYGARGDEALCQAYAKLSIAARRYRAGRDAAYWRALRRAPSAATRWIWTCLYPRPYQPLVRAAEQRYELPEHLIHAVMRQESGFRPVVVSPADAVGLMQLIPSTAQKVARELSIEYSPGLLVSAPDNIRFGSHYLHKVLDMFGGNLALAAAAYNAGPAVVSRWLASGEKLPLDVFVARIPYRETRVYVARVIGNLAHYAYLWSGAAAVPELSLDLPQGLRAGPDAY